MGNNYCCLSPESTEELLFKEFWNIKLRTKTQKDLIEFMQAKSISEKTLDLTNSRFELVIADYLLPLKKNWNSFYMSFWVRIWNESLKSKSGPYYIFISLLLLAINNKVEFTNSLVQLNLMFPGCVTDFNSAGFLDFYFKLLTTDCLREAAEINEIDQEQLEKLAITYGEKPRKSVLSKMLKDTVYPDNYLFVVENYLFLSDDVFIRDSFRLNVEANIN